jgi:hypothetical protein
MSQNNMKQFLQKIMLSKLQDKVDGKSVKDWCQVV